MVQEIKEPSTQTRIDEEIQDLLKRSPSDADNSQTTNSYTSECIRLTTEKVKSVFIRQYPDLVYVQEQLTDIARRTLINHRSSDLLLEDDKKFLKTPNSQIEANAIVTSASHANPDLIQFKYAITTYGFPKKDSPYAKFPGFNQRLQKIMEVGNLKEDSPEAQILAVSFLTQAAKHLSVDKAKVLLKKIRLFGGINGEQNIQPFIDRLSTDTMNIQFDQSYISRGLNTVSEIASGANLDENQVWLLQDLAFMKADGFSDYEEFNKAIAPIATAVGRGDWESAFKQRDFLLKYFSATFPEWRSKKHQKQTAERTYKDFKDLAKAVLREDISSEDVDVPPKYMEFMQEYLPKKLKTAEKNRDNELATQSVPLSNSILKELAKETATMLFADYLKNQHYKNPITLIEIISKAPSPEDFNQFLIFLEKERPSMTLENARRLFASLTRMARNATGINQRPYLLRTPRPIDVGDITLDHEGKQITYSPTERRTVYFGDLLSTIIKASKFHQEGRPILSAAILKKALKRAYELQKSDNPDLDYTLLEYLDVVIRKSAGSKKHQIASEKVNEFLAML